MTHKQITIGKPDRFSESRGFIIRCYNEFWVITKTIHTDDLQYLARLQHFLDNYVTQGHARKVYKNGAVIWETSNT